MWEKQMEWLRPNRVQRFRITKSQNTLCWEEVLAGWRSDPEFRSFFSKILANSPFPAYRWETPRLTSSTLHEDFEFVLLRCDGLDRPVDPVAFKEHFSAKTDVVSFPNLGRNAIMVVPCPVADWSGHGHLASFVRGAPESQVQQLWHCVAKTMDQRLSDRPVWLSTAGMGVSWLHVRLDDRPKYYGHAPYREAN